MKEIAGIKVAFINFCENEFSIADDESSGSSPLDLISNYRQIREAKSRADYVFVIVHGGHEYYSLPSPRMKKTYRWFCDIGADAVINHHQHCYSGYEMHNGKLIFYGLGNFCFDHPKHRRSSWNEGYMVELFTASKNETLNFNLIPFNQCNDEPTIIPMLEKNKDAFLSNINRINEIISDDVQLEERFTDWCKIKTEVYKKALCPFSGVKILERLYNKGLLRWSLPNNKKTLLYNLIFCESHYDVFKEYLKDEYTDIIT